MIKKISIECFKSIQSQEVDLGRVNVFIGGNGSGKSNLLEAIGVLSVAANGRVDDQNLLQKGVRPGVPRLYKSAFEQRPAPHIGFSASNDESEYNITLHNPLTDPKPAWRFKTEKWIYKGKELVNRYPKKKDGLNPENGLAALVAVNIPEDSPTLRFLRLIQGYVVFSPTTPGLRGFPSEVASSINPIALTGGRLPEAISELLKEKQNDPNIMRICSDALSLIDWAKSYNSAPSLSMPLSPAASVSRQVIRFEDKYMRKGSNEFSGYDASEGALYVLFLAVLAGHPMTPGFFAIDNADHGLNPRLAMNLSKSFCEWILGSKQQKQVLITTHNPSILDGLPLDKDDVRLFTVDRDNKGRTIILRFVITDEIKSYAEKGWTLSRLWMNKLIRGVPNV